MWSDLMCHNADFSTGPPDVQKRTQIRSRAMRRAQVAANIAKLPELVRR
jgi:hypothetical protein